METKIMKNNKKNAYKGYKRAHFYTMIGSIALGLCLIIATIIIVCFFSVEVKVENPTTTVTQIQPNNVAPATTNADNDEPKSTDAESNTNTTEDTTTPTAKTEENTDEVKNSTLTVKLNIYTGVYTLTYIRITKPVGTTLTREEIKNIILELYPSFNDIRGVHTPDTYTFTDADEELAGEFKIKTVAEEVIEATETEENNPVIIPEETEEPTAETETVETPEPVAEATETEPEEPAQAPTETEPEEPEATEEPTEEINIDVNKTSTLTVTVNIYTNICKTVFVNIEKPVGTTMSRQEIKDYILSLYPGFTRVRATGTPESYTFVEEDGKFPGTIKID